MKKTEFQKGITLIALIITIVVLLLLALVTIGAVEESKIIGHSKNASSEYVIEQEKEKIKLAYNSYKISKNVPIERTEEQDMLEQYFLGKNKQGLDLLSLVDGDNSTDVTIKFKDIDITITQENLTLSEDNKYVYISLDYYNNEYKLTIEDIDGNLITKELEYYKTEPMLEIDGAKIEGNGKTGWGIKFNNTNNKYTLNSDGTIEEKEFDNWFIAWVSDGSKWSNTQYSKGDEITEEYTIIAKMYKTGEKVIFPDGTVAEEYHMKIEGNGPMAPLFNDKGELSSGVAWMDNVNFSNPQAWKWTSVTKLIIGEGITDISTGAFVYGVSLKEVTLPDTLNTIGRRSFWLMCVFDKYNNSRECNFDWKKSVL